MAKTSGTDPQALSLPNGGGAVQGLGATFETDLNTGTGSYSIPIDLPAGPNGIAPTVTLRYSSSAGNGPFGIGWTLGAITVARKTDARIPDYSPGSDAYVLVGVEDLIPIGGGFYRPRVDTMNWRIQRVGPGWLLTDTRGLRHSLGAASESRVETTEDGLTKTAQWLLDAMTDNNGNAVGFAYRQEGAQRYLERIDWGAYSLRFTYEARPDVISTGRYGFLFVTALRCAGIELHVPGLTPSLTRSWTLNYTPAPGSGHSLLTRVVLRGHAADGSAIENPPLTLDYAEMGAHRLTRFSGPAPGMGPGRFEAGRSELLDWDGDGLPDVVEIEQGRMRVWPNLGEGRWGAPRSLCQVPSPLTFDEPGVAFADMEGNGTADLIVADRPLAGFYPHAPGGGLERLVQWRNAPATPLSDRAARLVDLDGDGVVDLLVTGKDYFALYYRDGADGWRQRPQLLPRPEAPPVSFLDPHVALADMNGDGLQDLVRVDGGGVIWWPYCGHGRWLEAQRMGNAPVLARQYDPRRLMFSDVDGDGCADLVYVGPQSVTVWLNQGGQRLSDPIEIPFMPFAAPGQFRLADMLGDGAAGVLYSSVAEGARRGDYLYLDLAGGVKPYLLTRIDNGLGGRVDIDYRPSTDFAVAAADAGQPWRTFHPFPVPCVAEVRATDLVTGGVAATRNHYHEARYDGSTRRFLGFAIVDVDTVGDGTIPTLRTRNVYHIGLDPADPERRLSLDEALRFGALRRRLLRTEMYGIDGSPDEGKPYQIVTHEYAVNVIASADEQRVLTPFETRTYEEQWERGPAPFALREIRYLDLDEYGNVRRQQTRTWRPGELQDDELIVTEASFALNLADYLVSYPARVTQRDGSGNVLAAQVTTYDGPDFVGLAEGQIGAGNATRQELLAVSDALAADVYGAAQPDWAALGYHRRGGETGWWIDKVRYGRPDPQTLVVRSARGFDSTMRLDTSRQFPESMTDPTGAAISGAIDPRAFQMGALTDANGNTTRDRFDPLGRVVSVVKPDDTDAWPTCAYEYRVAALPPSVISRERIDSGLAPTRDTVTYATGRGELLQTITPGEGDAGRKFIVQETREYNARSLMSARALPYYSDSAEYAPAPAAQPRMRMRYDALGRVIEQVAPDGSRITHALAPGRATTLDDAARALSPPRTLTKFIDGLKRTVRIENQLASHVAVESFAYDLMGRLVRHTAPNGAVTRTTIDGLGRVLVEENPDSGRTVFTFDAAGNQVARANAAGQMVRHTVDSLERLVEVRYDGAPAPVVTYTYLNPGDPLPPDGAQNRIGRLWRVTDSLDAIEFAYEALGRITRQARTVGTLARTFQTDWTYDSIGRATEIILPETTSGAGRRVIKYSLNARGLPANSPGVVKSVDYDVFGNARGTLYQNGTRKLAEFDLSTGRPKRLRLLAPDGVTALRDQTLTFDHAGNLTRIDSPITVEAGSFRYDDWYHLIEARYDSGEHFSYEFADGGNVTLIEGLGALTYAGAQSSRVTAAGNNNYAYDAAGRMRAGPLGQLTFDAAGSLVHIDRPGGETIDYAYDFRGKRVIKSTSAGQRIVVVDECLEFHGDTPVLWLPFGTSRVMVMAGAGAMFVHADWLGAYNLFTGLDGNLTRRLAFGPYGTLRSDSAAPPPGEPDLAGFAGRTSDLEFGLICLGRRFLDPTTGRFLSPDMVIGDLYRLDAWNRYLYAYGNPLRYIDPTGYFSWGDFFGIVAVVIVVAALVVAGFFTGGATWAVAGVVINVSAALFATAVGVAAGAIIGGYAAYKAGGDIWKGVLFGGLVGGVAAFGGGVLGAIAGSAVGGLFGSASLWSMLAAGGVGGAVQGAIAGIGTGAAIGFAGGKGSAALMWQYIWRGAAMGAITGFILGVASAYIFATPNASLQVGLGKITSASASEVSTYDSAGSLAESITRDAAEGTAKHGWGVFVSVGNAAETPSLTFAIPIGWVPNVMFNYGGISTLVSVGITFDKYDAAHGFDFQFLLLLSVAPYFVGTFFDIWDWQDWGHIHESLRSAFSTYNLPNSG
jgi:RHS repeat-associated protein